MSYLSRLDDKPALRLVAGNALRSLWTKWEIQPINLVPLDHGIVEVIGAKLRSEELLPTEEVHDSLVLAEAALLGCQVLLTSDAHLRRIDFQRLTLLLRDFDVTAPVIATPREIVRKFYR